MVGLEKGTVLSPTANCATILWMNLNLTQFWRLWERSHRKRMMTVGIPGARDMMIATVNAAGLKPAQTVAVPVPVKVEDILLRTSLQENLQTATMFQRTHLNIRVPVKMTGGLSAPANLTSPVGAPALRKVVGAELVSVLNETVDA